MSERVNAFAERVTQSGQTHSMELIFFPLFILLIVGITANNFAGSGIQTTPTEPTPFCQMIAICFPTNTTGCDLNVQNCNITAKTTFSFLNPNSPFTLLLSGNILGFVSSALNAGETHNIISSGYTICIPQINGKYANESGMDIHFFQCLGLTATGNATFTPVFPQTGIPINLTSNIGNSSQWYGNGCAITGAGVYPCVLNYGNGIESWNNTNNPTSFYAFYVKNGTQLTGSSNCSIFVSAATCISQLPYLYHASPTFTCPSTHKVNGININATTYYCVLPTNNPTTSTNSLPNSFSALSFLFGAILFFLGFGFAITSALIGFSVDAQGTRLAQVFGIGILVWSFIYGEFGSWLTFLPFNLSIISFISLTAIFFMGLYWRMFAWD